MMKCLKRETSNANSNAKTIYDMKQDQHYVPQAYLKRFMNVNRKIYTIRNDVAKPSSTIKEFSPRGTGYQQNFYTIKEKSQMDRFGIEDPNFIEKYFSRHLEKNCNHLIDLLINSPETILKNDALDLINLLLSFKQRNPQLRKKFENKENIKAAVMRRLQDIVNQRAEIEPLIKKYDNKTFEEFMIYGTQKLNEFIDNPDTPTNTHTEGLLSFLTGQEHIINDLSNSLLSSSWVIYKSTDKLPFITSDNPGFCIDTNWKIESLNFSNILAFCFPLSPQYCLVITGLDSDYSGIPRHKKFQTVTAGEDFVNRINKGSFSTSYKYVYSNDENTLRVVWQRCNDTF